MLGLDPEAETWGYTTVAPGKMIKYLSKGYPLAPGVQITLPPGTNEIYSLPQDPDKNLSPVIYAQAGRQQPPPSTSAKVMATIAEPPAAMEPRAVEAATKIFNALYNAEGDVGKAATALGDGEEAASLRAANRKLDGAIKQLRPKTKTFKTAALGAEGESDKNAHVTAEVDIDEAIALLAKAEAEGDDKSAASTAATTTPQTMTAMGRSTGKVDFDLFWVPLASLVADLVFSELPLSKKPKTGRSAFMGYVAVSQPLDPANPDSERDAVFVWRGTIFKEEWAANFVRDKLVTFNPGLEEEGKCRDAKASEVGVHAGFRDLYMRQAQQPDPRFPAVVPAKLKEPSAPRDVVTQWLKKLQRDYHHYHHSLGGALSTLSAYDIGLQLKDMWADTEEAKAARKGWKTKAKPTVTAITFAAPRVGNLKFRTEFRNELKIKQLRICNVGDIVPKVPGILYNALDFARSLFSEDDKYFYDDNTDSQAVIDKDDAGVKDMDANPPGKFKARWDYRHVGTLLKQAPQPRVYLHFLDKKGVGTTNRNPLLLNKSDHILVDKDYPAKWWHDKMRKGYKLGSDGRWKYTKPITQRPQTRQASAMAAKAMSEAKAKKRKRGR
ncbi:hypothetical protein HYH03_003104 [Edaphochlamys debaryana]|uniref:Fungal lipase-type domain-containing protein n=1 Tax=Edaphochlamys debaryana TaxID=47281 RepID=A0A835YBZ4_9CHLO|nr:hypothetical protein HYH03_003104 [Edaphochlamys debaryana]|eukprot:KAG2498914.1 hypothetical protein HYH03_003104 [Edaphochlamys debaryana]